MHDLLREFARDRVLPEIAVDERDAAVLRLLDHNLLLAESCGRLIEPRRYRVSPFSEDSVSQSTRFADRATALEWIQAEWPALVDLCRMAAARGLHSRCWQLSFALRDYFFLAKLWEPWIDTHRAAVMSARAVGADGELATALNSLGIALADRGDLTSAVGHYQEALKLFHKLQDEHGLTSALSNLAWASLYLGKYEKALRELHVALEAYRRLGNPRNAAITLRAIALVETELTLYHDAVEHAFEARREFQALDLPLDVVMSINCLAWAYFQSGEFGTAAAHYEQAVILGEQCGSRYETARAITGLGNVEAVSGHLAEAAEHWRRADELHRPLEPTMIGEARIRSTMWLGGDTLPGVIHGRPGG
jgi:tetratricopeptide (TPR) repeat protein